MQYGCGPEDLFFPQQGSMEGWQPWSWSVAPDWQPVMDLFFSNQTGKDLGRFVSGRLSDRVTIFPVNPLRAFELTPLASVKVVILGQDPYHGPGQAEGLAFSVPPGIRVPPSLRNIFKEVDQSRDPMALASERRDGSLLSWARQGVLLLNTSLTVEQGKPASHAGQGWEALTDEVVRRVAALEQPVVFMLWGAHAQSKRALLESAHLSPNGGSAASAGAHLVLAANHPSPLSARRGPIPFLGCGHFRAANEFLQRMGRGPVDW